MLTEFDATKFYLGILCSNGHEWESSGQSLRYLNDKKQRCVTCRLEAERHRYHKNLDQSRKYNREKRKRLYAANPEKIKEVCRKSRTKCRQNQSIAERQKELEKARRRYQLNREKIRLQQKTYYQENQEARIQARLRAKKWREANPELFKQHRAKWSQSKQGKLSKKVNKHKRRAIVASCHRVPYTTQHLKQLWEDFDNCCAYCGATENLTVDHLIPIAKGGTDTLGNLLVACGKCNSSKAQSSVESWYKAQPFFSKARWKKIQKRFGKAIEGQLTLF